MEFGCVDLKIMGWIIETQSQSKTQKQVFPANVLDGQGIVKIRTVKEKVSCLSLSLLDKVISLYLYGRAS